MAMPARAEPQDTTNDYAALMRPANPAPVSQRPRLAVQPTLPFLLRHHPTNWEVEAVGLEKPTWLPDIGKLVITAGAHLIRTRSRTEDEAAVLRHALDVDRHNGWITLDAARIIPRSCLPAGVPEGGYIRALPCRDPRTSTDGEYHLEAWDMPRTPVPGSRQKFAFDRASYNRWRLWLVETGQVPEPADDILRDTIAALVPRIARNASLPIPDDLRKVRVAAIEARLGEMQKAASPEADEAELPAPPSRARKQKAKGGEDDK